MTTNGTNGRRFTPLEEQHCVATLLGERAGTSEGRPYLQLKCVGKRPQFVIKRRGLPPIRTGIRLKGGSLAGAELLQARWAWATHESRVGAKPH